jgi:hypothetical protein
MQQTQKFLNSTQAKDEGDFIGVGFGGGIGGAILMTLVYLVYKLILKLNGPSEDSRDPPAERPYPAERPTERPYPEQTYSGTVNNYIYSKVPPKIHKKKSYSDELMIEPQSSGEIRSEPMSPITFKRVHHISKKDI